jgi:ABC-2 type transport system ATP-binding protein
MHGPDLIILDEPFSGLDPLNVQLMKEIIREQQARGAATIFSTHQMTDVEELCERVLLINEGQTLLYGRLDELKRSRGTHSVRIDAKRAPNTAPGATQVNGADGHYDYALA